MSLSADFVFFETGEYRAGVAPEAPWLFFIGSEVSDIAARTARMLQFYMALLTGGMHDESGGMHQ